MDMENLMNMAKQLRDRIASAQGEAQNLRVQGESGAGMVRVTMNGQHELMEVSIDPKLMQGEVKLLEDLVRAAVNHATAQVVTGIKENMGNMAKTLGVDISQLDGMMPGPLDKK